MSEQAVLSILSALLLGVSAQPDQAAAPPPTPLASPPPAAPGKPPLGPAPSTPGASDPVPLHRWSLGLGAGATLTDFFSYGLKVEARAELRFVGRFAVRGRLAWYRSFPTGLSLQLSNFGVLPVESPRLLFYGGADGVVYPWWSERYGRGFGVALVASLGAGAAGLGFGVLGVSQVLPMGTVEGGLSISLWGSRFFLDVLGTGHMVGVVKPYFTSNVALSLSWAFL